MPPKAQQEDVRVTHRVGRTISKKQYVREMIAEMGWSKKRAVNAWLAVIDSCPRPDVQVIVQNGKPHLYIEHNETIIDVY